jgi:hypothetical protein
VERPGECDGFLCPLVFRDEVEGATGEKRIVRLGIIGLNALLQAEPERAALFAGHVGEGSPKRGAKRCQGFRRERC